MWKNIQNVRANIGIYKGKGAYGEMTRILYIHDKGVQASRYG